MTNEDYHVTDIEIFSGFTGKCQDGEEASDPSQDGFDWDRFRRRSWIFFENNWDTITESLIVDPIPHKSPNDALLDQIRELCIGLDIDPEM